MTPGKIYYEQVLLRVMNYPTALIHIDTFYTDNGNDIYERLVMGHRVEVKAVLSIVRGGEAAKPG